MFVPDPGSEFFHPGSRVKKIPDPDQRIPDIFLIISDPGVKKASDPGSGSVALFERIEY
jgi:hypothetical protein